MNKKTIIIIGATSGIGRALFEKYAAEGNCMGIVGRRTYRKNERSLSPAKGRGMVYGGEVITLSLISETSHLIYLSVTLEISPLS